MIYLLIGISGIFCLVYMIVEEKNNVNRKIERKLKLAMKLQRNGKLREYGKLMKEIEDLERK